MYRRNRSTALVVATRGGSAARGDSHTDPRVGSDTIAARSNPCPTTMYRQRGIVEAQMTATPATKVHPSNPLYPRGGPEKILLVEDNRINQQFALALLNKAGHRVEVVDNGHKAVDAVRRLFRQAGRERSCFGVEFVQRHNPVGEPPRKCRPGIDGFTEREHFEGARITDAEWHQPQERIQAQLRPTLAGESSCNRSVTTTARFSPGSMSK